MTAGLARGLVAPMRPALLTVVPIAVAMLLMVRPAAAFELEQQFDRVSSEQVVAVLHQQCFEAGMSVEMPSDMTVACSSIVIEDDDLPAGVHIGRVHDGHVVHHVSFSLARRGEGVRVWANAWLEIVEPDGATLEEDLDSALYANRVQRWLTQLADEFRRSQASDTEHEDVSTVWSAHYESEFDWRLDAHLRAVRYCDQRLDDLDDTVLDEALRGIGLRPPGSGLRDRCEALYEVIYEWGLARGMEQPALESYFEYREALPPAERLCFGRLALANHCDRIRD